MSGLSSPPAAPWHHRLVAFRLDRRRAVCHFPFLHTLTGQGAVSDECSRDDHEVQMRLRSLLDSVKLRRSEVLRHPREPRIYRTRRFSWLCTNRVQEPEGVRASELSCCKVETIINKAYRNHSGNQVPPCRTLPYETCLGVAHLEAIQLSAIPLKHKRP